MTPKHFSLLERAYTCVLEGFNDALERGVINNGKRTGRVQEVSGTAEDIAGSSGTGEDILRGEGEG